MRIVQLIPGLGLGGLERVATTLALGLAKRGEDVVVWSGGSRNPSLRDELQDAGVPVIRIPRPWTTPWAQARSVATLARLTRAHRPDIIHTHNPSAASAAAMGSRLGARHRPPLVATFHGVPDSQLRLAALLLRFAADVVVGVGETATGALVAHGLPSTRARTLRNAVEAVTTRDPAAVRRELGLDGAQAVVTVGRFAPEKNQTLLLEACAVLAQRHPGLRVLLVGYGELEQELRNRGHRLGLGNVVVGPRTDAMDIVAAADVFALTSDREGLPLAVLEAMAVGTPVVATRVGGIPEFVRDGETGLTATAGDAAGVADAIGRLLDDPQLGSRLAANARHLATEEFGVARMVDGYLEIYRGLLRT